MKKSVFNLLFMILCIVIWVLNPWPFESSKTYYIEKTQIIRGGFDLLFQFYACASIFKTPSNHCSLLLTSFALFFFF